jgi:DNA-nicking Smr family endonuclease
MAKQKKKVTDISSSKASLIHNPFNHLKGLVDREDLPPSMPANKSSQRKKETISDQQPEEQLFLEAMKGVNPIARDHARELASVEANVERKLEDNPIYIPKNEALSQLVRLVNHGEGFIVSDTPEYIEGTGYNVRQEYARRLHQGDYSIQAHIDLHGMNVENAKEAFESFMKTSFISGKGAVLIIHGRGLSSPGEAILKNKVREWLSHSYWRKRVLAYASAQSYDGGAGATYVLLRSRMVSKRSGKSKSGI